MDSITTTSCGMPYLAMALLTLGLVFCGLFAALGGLTLTQLATPALGAARLLGIVAVLIGLVAIWFTQTQLGSGFYLTIASLPIVFGGLVFLAARKMAREQQKIDSAGAGRPR